MKTKLKTYYKSLLLFVALLFMMPEVNFAEDGYGQSQITEGKEYWLGIPHCRKMDNEPFRGTQAVVIWISSRVETKATVYAEAIGYEQTFRILPNEVKEIPIYDQLMHKESEIVKDNGIRIKAQDPISVSVYISYKWTGEAYRVIPLEWLGKDYVTLNMYLDKTDKYKPPQILIIATEDDTKVTYRPTANTTNVQTGNSKTVFMQKGQTYLIEGKIELDLVQDWASDLTGTQITSNKRIAVLSGHTKGAFPRYTSSMLGVPANFMRNLLIEMVLPNSVCGTEYISAPIHYANRPRPSLPEDNKGDLIRLVAIEDDTDIQVWNNIINSYKTIYTGLEKGEYYDFTSQEEAALYKTTKPVLAGQYGKTWWNSPVRESIEELDNKNNDKIQNPSRNGQGMLMVLSPMDKWINYGSFRSPHSIDNFVYITFDSNDIDDLYFDGQSFIRAFGQSSYGFIEGTDYAYLTQAISAGDHFIEGENGAKFAAYAYGNWDRSKDGFAYGYPVGTNFALPCDDSLLVIDNIICGDVEATASVFSDEDDCAAIYNIWVEENSYNYEFRIDDYIAGETEEVNFFLYVQDMCREAKATVTVMTKTGRTYTKTYEYIPEQIEATPNPLDFHSLLVGDSKTLTLTLHNPGTVITHVEDLKLLYDRDEYIIDVTGTPVDIAPNESVDVDITATAFVAGPVMDSVIAVLSCYENSITELKHTTSFKKIYIDDAHFGDVEVDAERTLPVLIINTGPMQVTITGITDFDRLDVFSHDLDKYLPLTIEVSDSFEFQLTYAPITPNVLDADTIFLIADTDEEKIYSIWSGRSLVSDVELDPIHSADLKILNIFPNPVTESGNIQIEVHNSGNYNLEIFDLFGNVLRSTSYYLDEGSNTLEFKLNPQPSGLYIIRISNGAFSATKMFTYIR